MKKIIKPKNKKVISQAIKKEIIEEVKKEIIEELPLNIIEEIKPEIIKNENVVNEIKTMDSSSMLDDLMSETDKDNEPENEIPDDENYEEDINSMDDEGQPSSSKIDELGDKLTDTLQSGEQDWQNPTDYKKMCAVNAMMFVEAGAILVSFLGQLISGDWSTESEKKYMPSEERRKLIRNPLAKKFELNKNKSTKTPMSALITAILFTIIPIILIAFKDRKKANELKAKTVENIRLQNELQNANSKIQSFTQPISKKVTGKRGRHKKDCQCDKCLLK